MMDLLITIDGPAGAGKTTVSRMLAQRLGYDYIDTGALYRGIAYAVYKKGVDINDETALERVLSETDLRFEHQDDQLLLFLGNEEISGKIRTPEITMLASAVSAIKRIRDFLLDFQRGIGHRKKAVFEGRDMGTVVFPGADVKFFLDAACEVRALRRFKQMGDGGGQTLDQVHEDIVRRDRNDSTRTVAPLRPANDAIIIDSSRLDAEGVVDLMVDHVRAKVVR